MHGTLLVFVCLIFHANTFLFKSRSSSSSIKVGSFNLRRYSLNKTTSSSFANLYISKILARYDLVFLQEIIDQSYDNQVVNSLLNHVNKRSRKIKYEAIISPSLGKTSYKERFVYLYRSKSPHFQIISSFVYNGSVSGLFERPPFILNIKLSLNRRTQQLTFVGVHLKPDSVYVEFRHLRRIIDELPRTSFVLLGDFNADCTYLNNVKKKELRQSYFADFEWLIDDKTETNLLGTCSYDRILVSKGTNSQQPKVNWVSKSNGIFAFDKKFALTQDLALKISDHYPVEVGLC